MIKNHRFKKKLGQNFLKDKNITEKISNSLGDISQKTVIEIGTGMGDLTIRLMTKAKKVVSYEIDKTLKEYLQYRFIDTNVEVVFEDFLKTDLKRFKNEDVVVIANIPYYITTEIIIKVMENLPEASQIYLVQKELANRFKAKPGTREYGRITALLNYYYDIKVLFNVNKNCFYPTPRVDSSVIRFLPKPKEKIKDKELFHEILKSAYQFKRKTIKNNLKKYDLKTVEKVLKKHGFNLNSRSEEIPVGVFVEITNTLSYIVD